MRRRRKSRLTEVQIKSMGILCHTVKAKGKTRSEIGDRARLGKEYFLARATQATEFNLQD